MRSRIFLLLPFLLCFLFAAGQNAVVQGNWKELLAGPAKTTDYKDWNAAMLKWRTKIKDSLKYKGSNYRLKGLNWVQSSYIQTQMMVEDRYFYNPITRKYTVGRYLEDLKKRYGGIDAVLIWPTYPNIGVDNRNQFDLFADMPGGIKGVKQMVAEFKKRGIRVFFPIMPWDRGTRDEGTTIAKGITKEMAEVEADGLNGDTMYGIPADFFIAKNGNTSFPLALEPEINMQDLKMLEWNCMSWAYYDDYTYVPGVSLYKYLEPLHMPVVNNRWAIDKTNDLQYAFFNGIGYTAWENIWGIWNQVPKRYAETIRRMSMIYRRYPDIFHCTGWEPHTPVLHDSVFASKFPGQSQTLWTFVNRGHGALKGPQIKLPYQNGVTYFDLWKGEKLTPQRNGNFITLGFKVEGDGYGCILEAKNEVADNDLTAFLAKIRLMAGVELNSLPADWHFLPQHLVNIPATKPYRSAPKGMVSIPDAKAFNFDVNGVLIEGDDIPKALDVQYPWDDTAGRSHHHVMPIHAFYIDQYPVTNGQFKVFLNATHYRPADAHNFLKYWRNGNYPPGFADKPVTWVSIEDARVYARWAGKRLPHEWEWQYAAQGTDKRLYPWGATMDPTRMPQTDSSRNMRVPTAVTAYPTGESPFGVRDLVGNVWQWTDEYIDDHTRAAVLRGGSYFHATTSQWYFPQAHKLNEHGKYLLMSPGRDRSANIGFRCVADEYRK